MSDDELREALIEAGVPHERAWGISKGALHVLRQAVTPELMLRAYWLARALSDERPACQYGRPLRAEDVRQGVRSALAERPCEQVAAA